MEQLRRFPGRSQNSLPRCCQRGQCADAPLVGRPWRRPYTASMPHDRPRVLPPEVSGGQATVAGPAVPTPRHGRWRAALRRRPVREVARQLGRDPATVLDDLRELDEPVKSASSRISLSTARRLRRHVLRSANHRSDLVRSNDADSVSGPPLARGWIGLPSRKPNFTGRQAILAELRAALAEGRASASEVRRLDEALLIRPSRRMGSRARPSGGAFLRYHSVRHGRREPVRLVSEFAWGLATDAGNFTRRFLRSVRSILRRAHGTNGILHTHVNRMILALLSEGRADGRPGTANSRSVKVGTPIRGPNPSPADMQPMSVVQERALPA